MGDFWIILGPFLIIDYFRNFLAFFEDLLILILQKSEALVLKVVWKFIYVSSFKIKIR